MANSNNFACFFVFCWHLFCFNILLLILIILTNKAMWRSGKRVVHSPSGPGFESQVPHFLNIFSLQVLLCAHRLAEHHASSSMQYPDGQRPDLVVHEWRSTIVQVHACLLDSRKSKKASTIGLQNCFLHHLFRPNTPLFYLFILFYFNCFIIFV